MISAITGSTEALSTSQTSQSFSKPVKSRREYDLKIEAMKNEKRELMMRSSSALADMQRAEQQAFKANQQITKLKKELRAANLAKSALQMTLESKEQNRRHQNECHFSQGTSCSVDESCKENESEVECAVAASRTDEVLINDGIVEESKLPLVIAKSMPSQSDKSHVDNEIKMKEPETTTVSGSELLFTDGINNHSNPLPLPEAKMSLNESPSIRDTDSMESLPEDEYKLTPTELGAELLINYGSPPQLPPMTMKLSSSDDELVEEEEDDENIKEVECNLESSVAVNDRLLTAAALVMVGLGLAPLPMTMIAQEKPFSAKVKRRGDASEVECTLTTMMAAVAKILSHHEMRCMHEMTTPPPPPVTTNPSHDDNKPSVAIRKGCDNKDWKLDQDERT